MHISTENEEFETIPGLIDPGVGAQEESSILVDSRNKEALLASLFQESTARMNP